MATREQKTEQLNKILASEVFRDKELYQNLLRYLVDASFNDLTPKEVTVAQEVFNKGADFNTAEDASVRVHMHNLRNKLDLYYHNEGQSDALKLYIPKGHYKVEFRKSEEAHAVFKWDRTNVVVALLVLIIAVLFFYIVVDALIFDRRYGAADVTRTNNHLWPHFFENDYPTHIVIGDFLIFHEYHEALDRNRRIMDYEITTAGQLEEYIQNNPEVYPTAWNLGELPHNAIFNVLELQPVFHMFHHNVRLAFSTEIDIDFIKNRNLIYIGEFKNLRALADLVTALPVHIETLPWWHGRLTFQQNDSLITLETSRDWQKSRYVTDLGILAKVPGLNNEIYIIVAGFGYNAQIKIVEIITHKESLLNLEKQTRQKYGVLPDHFVMVFEVKGFDRASTTADVRYFSPVEPEKYVQDLIPKNP